MEIPHDYRDLLRILNEHKVRYLVIGAYAVSYYAEPRYTKDFDIWIDPSPENAQRVYDALKEFGAPLKGIKTNDFTDENLVYQIGIAPVRIDIIMGPRGIGFDAAWKKRKRVSFFKDIKANIIGLEELMALKRKAKREIDKRDLQELRYIWRKRKGNK